MAKVKIGKPTKAGCQIRLFIIFWAFDPLNRRQCFGRADGAEGFNQGFDSTQITKPAQCVGRLYPIPTPAIFRAPVGQRVRLFHVYS